MMQSKKTGRLSAPVFIFVEVLSLGER